MFGIAKSLTFSTLAGFMGIINATFPNVNKALLRYYQGIVVVKNPLIRPHFLGGGCHWGGSLRFS